ncbi:MAG: nanoRNase/pAp phosphatase (c-di-AMP/oligoRNAs hydrolase) [Gammaproteobacteria bacterium]
MCAALLRQLDLIEDVKFVHPKDMQDGKIEITGQDITTNLPYVKEAHLAFDHHLSETLRIGEAKHNHVIDANAPSAARVVFDYYGGFDVFPRAWNEMMLAVDQADSAQYSRDEILKPTGWTLLNFLMDARTGLGRFHSFRVSNYHLMMELIDFCRHRTIADVLAHPDVVERVELFAQSEAQFVDQIRRCSKIYGDVIVLDLRQEETIFPGNRFMIYAMHPQCTLSVHALWGLKQMNTVFAVGKSIINRSSLANIGELMLSYEGGGHENAGTCQVPNNEAAPILKKILSQLNDAAKFSDNIANQPVHRAAG